MINPIRHINVIRYISPLREGGSLPAIAEGDDGFLYVLKFRGAGQGLKALIADFIGGELARALGLHMPEMVFAHLAEGFGRTEPDEEIQDLLKASTGLNLGVHFLSGALTFDPEVHDMDGRTASKIVWLDALLMNIDRTARNTNMLVWNKEIWLIDHGAALYFHHNWDSRENLAQSPFAMIKEHVLLPKATELEAVAAEGIKIITPELLHTIINAIPEEWLQLSEPELSLEEIKEGYHNFLTQRVLHSDKFVKQALDARLALI